MRSWTGGLTALVFLTIAAPSATAQIVDAEGRDEPPSFGRGAGLAWGSGTDDLDPDERAALAGDGRTALVVGNAGYGPTIGRVANPVTDAVAIADLLDELGFDVRLEINIGREAMLRALHVFATSLDPGGVGLVFYAGHMLQAEGRNFLVPVDADLDDLRTTGTDTGTVGDLASQTVELGEVLDRLERAPTRANFVILEAGFENVLVRPGSGSFRPGLARTAAPPRTLVAYATAPGQTVLSDTHRGQGCYTQALLELLPSPGIPVETLFRRVRERVTTITSGYQTPWESSSLVGDFTFRPELAEDEVVALRTRSAVAAAGVADWNDVPGLPDDVLAWDAIQESDEAADFEGFLKRFPKSIFAGFANKRVSDPEPSGSPRLELAELAGIAPDAGPAPDSLRLRPGQPADGRAAGAGAMAGVSMTSAMDLIRGAQYQAAAGVLLGFLRAFPAATETPEAAYLLGESFYLAGDFPRAAAMFAWNYKTFPGAEPRAPDNLLKLGMSLDALGETTAACLTYAELDRRYPAPPSHVSRTLSRERSEPACL